MSNNINNTRPIYLNLVKIRLPLTGMISLAHRASGVLLFFSIPFLVYLLDLSVTSESGFQHVQQLLNQPFFILLQIVLLWSFVHHFFAGIRFLLIDADIGVEKASSQRGAWLVLFAETITLFLIIYMVAV